MQLAISSKGNDGASLYGSIIEGSARRDLEFYVVKGLGWETLDADVVTGFAFAGHAEVEIEGSSIEVSLEGTKDAILAGFRWAGSSASKSSVRANILHCNASWRA